MIHISSAIVLAVVLMLGGLVAGQQLRPSAVNRLEASCPEDAALFWSGSTNKHSLCLTLDDHFSRPEIDKLPTQ